MASEDVDDGVIEVQVIPQDDNWGETATTITETATSYAASLDGDFETFDEKPKHPFAIQLNFKQVIAVLLSLMLCILAIGSPIAFIVLPIVKWDVKSCRVNSFDKNGTYCDGLFINLGVKILVLMVGLWALYIRPRKAITPRLQVMRIGVMGLAFVVIVCYWLFYALRVVEKREENLIIILNFAISLADSMLFLHYLSLILIWIRHTDPMFTIKVVRSVDGCSKYYNIGLQSLQRSAIFVLERYYRDFPEYNPYLERTPSRASSKRMTGLKVYDVDGKGNDNTNNIAHTRAVIAASARRREGRNDRFYEEAEFERRVKKRKARLFVAAEESFGHIARLSLEAKHADNLMDPEEAAQAIFPSLARPLQKYLRTTRQQPRFTMESIVKHLAHCISYDLSPKAFLEKYVRDQPGIAYLGYEGKHEWNLLSDEAPNRQLKNGMVFQLKRDDICLVITVRKMPLFKINEEAYDYDNNKFVLRLNSETSV